MFSLKNKKFIFELSAIPPLIWSSVCKGTNVLLEEQVLSIRVNPTEKGDRNESIRVAFPESIPIQF